MGVRFIPVRVATWAMRRSDVQLAMFEIWAQGTCCFQDEVVAKAGQVDPSAIAHTMSKSSKTAIQVAQTLSRELPLLHGRCTTANFLSADA